MAYARRIICLAYSTKLQHICVAGREIRKDGTLGPWIRPVGLEAEGALSVGETMYPTGRTPKLLDIIDIEFLQPKPSSCQRENHQINSRVRWRKVGTFPKARLAELVETPSTLWDNSDSSGSGVHDRVPERLAQHLASSLALIQPRKLAIQVYDNAYGKRKIRAVFHHHGVAYNIGITDPDISAAYRHRVGHHTIPDGQYYLCVSLGAILPSDQCRYKLAAAFVPVL